MVGRAREAEEFAGPSLVVCCLQELDPLVAVFGDVHDFERFAFLQFSVEGLGGDCETCSIDGVQM